MFSGEYARRQALRVVVGQYRYHRLFQDSALVQPLGHAVHRGTGKFATGGDHPFVGMQPGKRGQQRGMDVDQTPGVRLYKGRRQDTHKAGQQDQGRLARTRNRGDGLRQCGIKLRAVGKLRVSNRLVGNALLLGPAQACGVRPVADNCGNMRVVTRSPVFPLRRANQGGHIGAAAGNQNHNRLHKWPIIRRSARTANTHAAPAHVATPTDKNERSC